MNIYNYSLIAICLICNICAAEDGYKESLSIAEKAIAEVDISQGDRYETFEDTLRLLEKDKDSSKAAYEAARILYRSLLSCLLVECEQIESLEISTEEKAKKMFILTRKAELLLKIQVNSNEKFIDGLIKNHPRFK